MDVNSTEEDKTPAPPKLTRVTLGHKTDVGKVRRRNEDDLGWWVPADPLETQRKGCLYIVADGMGGHLAGDRASEMAVSIITKTYYEDPSPDIADSLCYAIEKTNERINEEASETSKAGMGTTVVCAVVRGHELYVAHVGDSRAYMTRGQAMQQLTEDHSWVEDQVRAGIITQEDARTHPQRNIITRSLGSRPEVEVDTQRRIIQEGDAILLCSDGLSGPVRDEDLQKIILSNDPQTVCDKLIELANENGGPDNITVISLRIEEVVQTPPELVPERYKSLTGANGQAPLSLPASRPMSSSIRRQLPDTPQAAAPQPLISGSRLKVVALGLLAALAVVICILSAGLWGLGPLSPFGTKATGTLPAITATAIKTPLQGNQAVITTTVTATPQLPTTIPPTPTVLPSPTETEIPPFTPTLLPLAPPPTNTPRPTATPTAPLTITTPLALVVSSAAWPQEPPTKMLMAVDNSQPQLTVTVGISSALPITLSVPTAEQAEKWVLTFNVAQGVTSPEPPVVGLSVAIQGDEPLRKELPLGKDSGQKTEVEITLGVDADGVWTPRTFGLLLMSSESAQEPVLLVEARPRK